ncbi:MAG: hypothetical protein Q9160_007133 [Pyrenula sp. 1 TL-2023]
MEEKKDFKASAPALAMADQMLSQGPVKISEEYLSLAEEATRREHDLSLGEAVKLYPKAIGWSLLISTAIIMEAFQLILVEQFLSYPAFRETFGYQLPDGTWQLSAPWQLALVNGACVGTIIGLWINGWISDHFGYKKTMLGALMCTTLLIFIPFFANNVGMLLMGQLLMGVPWGIFQTLAVSYAAEVSPTRLRAYLTTYINMCWLIGQIIASGILQYLVRTTGGAWAFRLPFALEWAWPLPLILGILFAPESPWWLVRKNRIQDARAALRRLNSNHVDADHDVNLSVALMVVTTEQEKANGTGTTYRDCFKGVDRRRTAISCAVSSMQSLSGAGLGAYSTYFYQQAGLPTDYSFTMTVAQYGVAIVGVFCTWFLLAHLGRRTIFLVGLSKMACCLLVIGSLGILRQNRAASWTIGSLFIFYQFVLNATVASVCFSLVAEIPSTRLRNKTIVLARVAYSILSIFSNIITPYMLNPTAWDWGAKAGFFWGGLCLLSAIYTYFEVPEPKGRTYGEMDTLFHQKVSARKFSKTALLESRKPDSVSSMTSADSWLDAFKLSDSIQEHGSCVKLPVTTLAEQLPNPSESPQGNWNTRPRISTEPGDPLHAIELPSTLQVTTRVPSPCLHVRSSSRINEQR